MDFWLVALQGQSHCRPTQIPWSYDDHVAPARSLSGDHVPRHGDGGGRAVGRVAARGEQDPGGAGAQGPQELMEKLCGVLRILPQTANIFGKTPVQVRNRVLSGIAPVLLWKP